MNNEKYIISKLVETGKWNESAARLGYKFNFKCTYCYRDLLASVNDYKEWQEDHIIPKVSNGPDTEHNIVLACRTCNVNLKGKWNPADQCGKNATKEELINAAREFISIKRAEELNYVSQCRNIVFGNIE